MSTIALPGRDFVALMLGQLGLSTKPNSPTSHSTWPALISPGQDKVMLKLSQAAQDRDYQLAVWGSYRPRDHPRI
jgi:hypothetical protein